MRLNRFWHPSPRTLANSPTADRLLRHQAPQPQGSPGGGERPQRDEAPGGTTERTGDAGGHEPHFQALQQGGPDAGSVTSPAESGVPDRAPPSSASSASLSEAEARAPWQRQALQTVAGDEDEPGAAPTADGGEMVGHGRAPRSVALALQREFEEQPPLSPVNAEPAWAPADQEAPPTSSAPAAPDLGLELPHEFDDVAVTIGRVLSIRGSVIWGALYDDADGATARAARMGALVSMRGPDSRVFGIVNALERDQQPGSKEAERTIFEVQVLGEIANSSPEAGFQRGISSYPPLDAPITTVTMRELAKVYARPRASSVHIGRLRHNPRIPAFILTDSLLGKHFAVLGTTGSGKSCAVTVILRSILDEYPNGHIILLDPHNEYATAFADRAELLSPANLKLPYWLLSFEEIAHILIGSSGERETFARTAILKDAIVRAKMMCMGDDWPESALTVDTPVPYRLADLVSLLNEGMGMLNKSDPVGPYLSLIARLEGLRADQRYAFMFQSLTVRDNMQQILAQLLRVPVDGKPITIIDISGVPSEIVDVVVSVLFRLTFELAVWSERGTAPPMLLVCEEAHRYVPADAGIGFAPTRRVIARIAKEGRKYGVTLCLVSQRPSELAISSLSQCNTIFALRMSNEHDQAFIAKALSENARWLVDGLPSLNTQEAVVVGDGVTVPVHIRFKDLPPEHRPRSGDPSFSSAWRADARPDFLDRAIDRWRRQLR